MNPVTYFDFYFFFYRPLTEDQVTAGKIGWQIISIKHNVVNTAYVSNISCPDNPYPIQVNFSCIIPFQNNVTLHQAVQ